MVLNTIINVLDAIFGLLGLILIVRIVLHLFRVSPQNPAMRVLTAITDPMVNMAYKILGIPDHRRYDLSTFASLAMALIENIQRENLNPLAEAHALPRPTAELPLTPPPAPPAVRRSRPAATSRAIASSKSIPFTRLNSAPPRGRNWVTRYASRT